MSEKMKERDDGDDDDEVLTMRNDVLLREGPRKEIINNGQREQIANALRPVIDVSVHRLLSRLTDTHCHLFARLKKNSLILPKELGAKEYVCVSTSQDDWKNFHELEKSKRVRLGLGVHPQCADEIEFKTNEWYERLEKYVNLNKSCVIGEIGLDRNKMFKSTFETHQKKCFYMQLRLAAKISRPVSVHCVKADGAIVDVLQSEIKKGHTLPPKICIHSFAGSVETLKRIVRLVEGRKKTKNVRIYVGMNCWTNLWKKQAKDFVNGVVKTIPNGISRFLLESDWHPLDFDFEGSTCKDVDKILLNGLLTISSMLGLKPEVMADHFESNTNAFFS